MFSQNVIVKNVFSKCYRQISSTKGTRSVLNTNSLSFSNPTVEEKHIVCALFMKTLGFGSLHIIIMNFQ